MSEGGWERIKWEWGIRSPPLRITDAHSFICVVLFTVRAFQNTFVMCVMV